MKKSLPLPSHSGLFATKFLRGHPTEGAHFELLALLRRTISYCVLIPLQVKEALQ